MKSYSLFIIFIWKFVTSPFKIVLVFNARQDTDGLVQERRNPIANALELRFSAKEHQAPMTGIDLLAIEIW